MKITYDAHTDTLMVVLRDHVKVKESDERGPGVVLDFDDKGNVVSFEILDASKRVSEAKKIEFQMTE